MKMSIPFIMLVASIMISSCENETGFTAINEIANDNSEQEDVMTEYYKYPFEYRTDELINEQSNSRWGGQIIDEVAIYAPNSGTTLEKEVRLDPGYGLTGVGMRVHDDGVVTLELEERFIYSDGTQGQRLRFCGSSTCGGTLEKFLAVPDGAYIVSIGLRANKDACALIQLEYRYIDSNARLTNPINSNFVGSGSPELMYTWSQAAPNYTYDRSVVTGLGLRVNKDAFVTLKAWVGKLE